MTITVDGDRSRKRLHIAEKALAAITAMGLPAKASMFEGFTYKVWQTDDGDMSGGRIVAPPGVLVTLAYPDGIRQFVCDSFETAALPVEHSLGGPYRWSLAPSPLPALEDGVKLLPNTAGLGVAHGPGGAVAFPFVGDTAAFCTAVRAGVAPDQHNVSAMQINGCYDTGADADGISYAPGFTLTHKYYNSLSGDSTFVYPFAIVPTLIEAGYFESVSWKPAQLFLMTGPDWVLSVYNYYDAQTGSNGMLLNSLLNSVSGIPPVAIDTMNILGVSQTGAHFVRTANDVLGVHIVVYPLGILPTAEEADWSVMLVFVSLANPSTNKVATRSTLGAVLDPLMYNGGALAYLMELQNFDYTGTKPTDEALYTTHVSFAMSSLCGWPMDGTGSLDNSRAVVFHDDAGDYYSVKITPSTIIGFKMGRENGTFEAATITLPQQLVDSVGVSLLEFRILHVTTGVYLCTVFDGADIVGLHIGSPLTGAWASVGLPADASLQSVRVMLTFTPTGPAYGFVGVGRSAIASVYPHRIFFMAPGASAWAAMSNIPLADTGYTDDLLDWDAIVFGDNALAQAMNAPIQYPIAA